jgi:hypothetical protein
MHERPVSSEAHEYYFKYINLVPDGNVVELLDTQRAETLSLLRSVPETRGSFRYGDGKWSAREVIGHINDTERVFAMRAFWFARAHETSLPSYESDAVVAISRSHERSWNTLVEEFDSVRAATLTLFRYLPDEAWGRRGIASEMPFSVRALAYISAGHVIHHLKILRERYL